MAIQTTIAKAAKLVRMVETGQFALVEKVTIPATTNGDSQVLLTMPFAARVFTAWLRVPATMGAAHTGKLQKRDVDTGVATDLTLTTTAATAGVVVSTGLLPVDLKAGDTIEYLASGANAVASAIEVDLSMQHA